MLKKRFAAAAVMAALAFGATAPAFSDETKPSGNDTECPGWGMMMGPGMMGPGMMGYGMNHGMMMGRGMMGYGMGPGMMGPIMGYGMHPGMMTGYGMMPGMGYGMNSGMMGYGMGPGMMGNGMGYGMGPGMMGNGMGYGMGPGMMGQGGQGTSGQGMMGQGMMGQGYMGQGRGMMGGAAGQLSVDNVKAMMERRLEMGGNPNLKLGKVEEKDDTITAEIVTKDGSLVQQFTFDRKTGWMRRAQ